MRWWSYEFRAPPAVHGHLRVTEAPDARIQVVDDEAAEYARVADNLTCLAIPLTDSLSWCARPLIFKLARGHDNRLHRHLLAGQLHVEAFAAALFAPYAEDERNLPCQLALVR